MNDEMRKALAKPFQSEKVQTKPGRGGSRPLKYISHGLVTERLNEVDPTWTWRVLTEHIRDDANGIPHCYGVTIEMQVGDVIRVEAGGPERLTNFADEIKNAYSDALKRAAMRFGVALEMWEDLVDAAGDEDAQHARPNTAAPTLTQRVQQPRPTPSQAAQRPVAGPGQATDAQRRRLWAITKNKWGDEAEQRVRGQMWARFRVEHSTDLTKQQISQLMDWIEADDLVTEEAIPSARVDPIEAQEMEVHATPVQDMYVSELGWNLPVEPQPLDAAMAGNDRHTR